MYPDTRGRISTDSTGSSRPVNSSHSFTSFSMTVTTLTGNAACCGAAVFLHPPAVRKIDKIPTLIKRVFIAAGSQSTGQNSKDLHARSDWRLKGRQTQYNFRGISVGKIRCKPPVQSNALVNETGEILAVDHEAAPFCIVIGGGFGGDDLGQCFTFLFSALTFLRTETNISRNSIS